MTIASPFSGRYLAPMTAGEALSFVRKHDPRPRRSDAGRCDRRRALLHLHAYELESTISVEKPPEPAIMRRDQLSGGKDSQCSGCWVLGQLRQDRVTVHTDGSAKRTDALYRGIFARQKREGLARPWRLLARP